MSDLIKDTMKGELMARITETEKAEKALDAVGADLGAARYAPGTCSGHNALVESIAIQSKASATLSRSICTLLRCELARTQRADDRDGGGDSLAIKGLRAGGQAALIIAAGAAIALIILAATGRLSL